MFRFAAIRFKLTSAIHTADSMAEKKVITLGVGHSNSGNTARLELREASTEAIKDAIRDALELDDTHFRVKNSSDVNIIVQFRSFDDGERYTVEPYQPKAAPAQSSQ
eukprot:303712-Amphidinium_carterae.1